MLTLRDCVDFCGLTMEQLEAVADHEHIADIIAAEWASSLLGSGEGRQVIRETLEDEIAVAHAHHQDEWENKCRHCLDEFNRDHPGETLH